MNRLRLGYDRDGAVLGMKGNVFGIPLQLDYLCRNSKLCLSLRLRGRRLYPLIVWEEMVKVLLKEEEVM